ncbi:hypothetical protein FGA82_21415 [Pseudomonas fluorescens]|nr:hypothetical protein FGA82_21415 [Pseudomonas fluorescens]
MLPWRYGFLIVPTLCVGMPLGTLRVPTCEFDAERQGLHSFAARGNELISHPSTRRDPALDSPPVRPA